MLPHSEVPKHKSECSLCACRGLLLLPTISLSPLSYLPSVITALPILSVCRESEVLCAANTALHKSSTESRHVAVPLMLLCPPASNAAFLKTSAKLRREKTSDHYVMLLLFPCAHTRPNPEHRLTRDTLKLANLLDWQLRRHLCLAAPPFPPSPLLHTDTRHARSSCVLQHRHVFTRYADDPLLSPAST